MTVATTGQSRTQAGKRPRTRRWVNSGAVVWASTCVFIAILIGAHGHAKEKMEERLRMQVVTIARLAADRAALAIDLGKQGVASPGIKDSITGNGTLGQALPSLDGGDAATLSQHYDGPLDKVDYVQSPTTGVVQMVTHVKVPRYQLYLAYGKDIGDLVEMWHYEKIVVTVATLLAIAISAIVTAGIRRRMTLTAQLQTVRRHLIESNNALRSALAASELVAAKDQLTGLWNRRTFDLRLQEAVAHHGRHDGVFSLLLLDLDHFKSINDRYGHVAGDEVLKRFADILHMRLRQNDVDARWGGEEFAILADGADLESAFLLAEHIRQAVEKTSFDGPGRVTVSIGIAEYVSGETGDDLLTRSDGALYEAKRTGRNRVVAASGLELGDRYFTSLTDASAPLFAQELVS